MARYLLGATMYIEQINSKDEKTRSLEENENVSKYLENPKNFKFLNSKRKNEEQEGEPKTKKPRLAQQLDDEIETGVRLMVEFAGFEEIDKLALEKLKNVFKQRFITASRQMSAAERRRKDGFDIPYKSPLEWTLKLNGIRKCLEIKEWYDVTYWTRFRALKMQLAIADDGDGKSENLN